MPNILIFKAIICSEVPKNKRQLHRALRRIEIYASIALNAGKVIGLDLKEMEKPKFEKPKNRKALGLNPMERFKNT